MPDVIQPNESETDNLVGQTFGQYEIGQQLGQGGMATVYLARQKSIGRTVAIKVMPRYFLHEPSFLQRFEREVKVIAELQHPRVLPVYDYGQINDRPFIVMAYMPGGTLADRIKKGPLPLDEVVRLVGQIAEGLDHAHNKGVIHRDFKPSNVLLDENGNAYLSDFGIAKITESTVQLTGSGIVGTPAYMAPEMADRGTVTPAVDIYALGVTLYQMLTGKFPYQGETPLRVMMAHATEPVPDVRLARPDLPEAVAEVVKRAMAKNPDDRYASAGELAAALRAAVQQAAAPQADEWTIPATTPAPPSPAPAPSSTPPPPPAPSQRPTMQAPAIHQAPTDIPAYTPPPPAAEAPKKRLSGCAIAGIVIGALVLVGGCIVFLALGGLAALGSLVATPTPTPTPTPTATPTPLPSPTPLSPPLLIENRSDMDICKVYLATPGSGTFGDDQLMGNVIAAGEQFGLDIQPGTYNIVAEYCDEHVLREYYPEATISGAGFTWTITSIHDSSLTVINNSSQTLCYLFVSLITFDTWGPDQLGTQEVVPPGQQVTLRMPSGSWDFRGETCDQQSYWENYNNVVNGTFEWTLTD
jgi:serine/threonine-protein kinase